MRRDRVALALTFLLPIMFFSIFASVFGNQGQEATSRVRLAVVDLDGTEFSRAIVDALKAEGPLRVRVTENEDGTGAPLDRARAETLVKNGDVPVAVILPAGLGAAGLFGGAASDGPKIQVLADPSDPIAPQLVQGLLQKVAFTAMPETMATQGLGMMEKYGAPLTDDQRRIMQGWTTELQKTRASGAGAATDANAVGLPMELVNVMQSNGDAGALVSFYAAGIGVMFLLFSCAGAGGSLLEEEESGTLSRLLGSRAGLGGVLAGKWMFVALMGVTQLIVMFLWGWAVFGLPLFDHIPGFLVMAVVTACAASAFGMLLASVCRTRAQLSGIATIVILAMSAVGGSMFPRFLMTDAMQQMGLATFNAWALDGFIKVFWRDARVIDLWPQVAVLAAMCVVFLVVARIAARRWDTA
jgi:ABC-2 type transport system permease protein